MDGCESGILSSAIGIGHPTGPGACSSKADRYTKRNGLSEDFR